MKSASGTPPCYIYGRSDGISDHNTGRCLLNESRCSEIFPFCWDFMYIAIIIEECFNVKMLALLVDYAKSMPSPVYLMRERKFVRFFLSTSRREIKTALSISPLFLVILDCNDFATIPLVASITGDFRIKPPRYATT